MSTMSRRTKLIMGAAVVLAAFLAAWLLFMIGEKADNGSAPDAVQSPRLDVSPLRLEDQSPVVAPTPMKETTPAVESPPNETAESGSVKAPVELLSWDDTHAEIARLVGIEYDALIQVLPKLEAMARAVDAAYEKVINGADPQYDYLREAIAKFQDHGRLNSIYDPRYPEWYDFHPLVLLVRAGRLEPDEMPHQKRTLPNGQVIRILPHEKYIVKFRQRGQLTEKGMQLKEAALQEEADLLERLSRASESEAAPLQSKLEEVLKRLERLTPGYSDSRRVHMWGEEDDPNLKVYEIDLGKIN